LNKNQKITLTVATLTVVIVALVASTYYLSGAQTQSVLLPSGEPPSGQLKVTGDVAAEKTLTVKELSKMPLTKVTTTIKGETATYVGVTVLELLNRTGANWDTGFINVKASDGFSKTINTYQAFNSTQYRGSEIILAFAKNGNWITDVNEGPLKLITPNLASGFNIKSVAEINLQPWVLSVSGAVSNPLTLTGGNVTNFEVKTVHAAFAPGGAPQRTSDWTGTSLWSFLEASGVQAGASKVTVTAIDGYSRDFTVTQVQDLNMLIGFKENGVYLPVEGGAPFRLFVPTEDFKWGQNWVRWVSEITVS
jgi:DMSO/TMAO reductase YedYZ molybdopterin-dependent catalytic subunit